MKGLPESRDFFQQVILININFYLNILSIKTFIPPPERSMEYFQKEHNVKKLAKPKSGAATL